MRIYKITSVFVCLAFLSNTILPGFSWAQDFRLPAPGVMVHLSPPLDPPILKGIKVNPDNPFHFDFILDKGDSNLSNDRLKDESNKMIKYFLASMTIPENDLWVNLSPYEKDRIIPQSFGLTEMGRDLLAEDYMLKQITASLIYPEDVIGKKFWKRIYEEAAKRFGTTNIPVNTFNKVWIVPEKAVVYENAPAGTAYVTESKLKVMLDQDYLSLQKHAGISSAVRTQGKETNQLGSQIVREIVIPELTKEVNEGKNFAQLRQVYNSLILATWYKNKIKDSILSQVYADKNKIAGVNIDDPKEKQRIYQKYLQAFKKGVYNYIKEEKIPYSLNSSDGGQTIVRKYFSGGILWRLNDGALTVRQMTAEVVGAIKEHVSKFFVVAAAISVPLIHPASAQTPTGMTINTSLYTYSIGTGNVTFTTNYNNPSAGPFFKASDDPGRIILTGSGGQLYFDYNIQHLVDTITPVSPQEAKGEIITTGNPTIGATGPATFKVGMVTFEAPSLNSYPTPNPFSPVFIAANSGIANGVFVREGTIYAVNYGDFTTPPVLVPLLGSDKKAFAAADSVLDQELVVLVGQNGNNLPRVNLTPTVAPIQGDIAFSDHSGNVYYTSSLNSTSLNGGVPFALIERGVNGYSYSAALAIDTRHGYFVIPSNVFSTTPVAPSPSAPVIVNIGGKNEWEVNLPGGGELVAPASKNLPIVMREIGAPKEEGLNLVIPSYSAFPGGGIETSYYQVPQAYNGLVLRDLSNSLGFGGYNHTSNFAPVSFTGLVESHTATNGEIVWSVKDPITGQNFTGIYRIGPPDVFYSKGVAYYSNLPLLLPTFSGQQKVTFTPFQTNDPIVGKGSLTFGTFPQPEAKNSTIFYYGNVGLIANGPVKVGSVLTELNSPRDKFKITSLYGGFASGIENVTITQVPFRKNAMYLPNGISFGRNDHRNGFFEGPKQGGTTGTNTGVGGTQGGGVANGGFAPVPYRSAHRPSNEWLKGVGLGLLGVIGVDIIFGNGPIHVLPRIDLTGGNSGKDGSMLGMPQPGTPLGGIDLTANKLNLELQNAGKEIKFHVDTAMLAQLRNTPGFTSVVLSMEPMTELSLKQFLGVY